MNTINNQYLTAGEPHRRFVKTVDHALTGWRLNPDTGQQIEFVLVSKSKEFDYDTEVLEVYSEREYKFLIQRNRYLFENGYLKDYNGEAEVVDMSNVLTDDEIFSLASTRLPTELKVKLSDITSPVTVKRVLLAAREMGRPAKVVAAIEQRATELDS